ncbi:hypothetical protein HGA91_02740 [candidate division WWE3 bacterium]|nr:hypothetical protein [candidate division WWE3 bacterium]
MKPENKLFYTISIASLLIVLVVLTISSSFPFKSWIFATIFPKTNSNAASGVLVSEPILPVSYWEEKMLSEVWPESSYSSTRCKQMSEAAGIESVALYHMNDCIDGMTAMFEATGKTQYLDRALSYVETIIGKATLQSDGYYDWNMPTLEEGHSWRTVVRMLRVMRETLVIYNNSTYRVKYNQILAFSEKHIFEKNWVRSSLAVVEGGISDGSIYRSRTHMASHWAMIAMELAIITENQTWKPRYLEVFNRINQDMRPYRPSSLREQLELFPGTTDTAIFHDEWIRKYILLGERTQTAYDAEGYHPVSDTHHGQDTIGYIVEGRNVGIYWNDGDMKRLANLFKNITWDGNIDNPQYGKWLDRTGEGTEGCIEEGFMMLGRYDGLVQKILQHDTPSGCSPVNFYGQMAVNAAILTNTKPATDPLPRPTYAVPLKPSAVSELTISTDCSHPTLATVEAGGYWRGFAHGIMNPKGVKIRVTNGAGYLAIWNGEFVYRFNRQLPYAPEWYIYDQYDDFSLYNSSSSFTVEICHGGDNDAWYGKIMEGPSLSPTPSITNVPTPTPSVSITVTPTPISTGCQNIQRINVAQGGHWYASEHGITNPSGFKMQRGRNSIPISVAKWNGSIYQYTYQIPLEPNWDTYQFTSDFYLYGNNQGAFSFSYCADFFDALTPTPTTIIPNADINHDGNVDVFDLGLLAGNYGKTITSQSNDIERASDINNDGVVSIFDLGILVSRYNQ